MLRRGVKALVRVSAWGLCWGLVAGEALAAPFTGTGHAPIEGKTDALKARDQALDRARRAALEAALEQVGAADAALRKKVVDEAALWTRSYRVLQQGDDGATATAVVSVEIDTGRLSKALAAPGPASTAPAQAPALAGVREQGCPNGAAEGLAQRMIGAGLLRDGRGGTISGAAARTFELRCREVGPVAYPHGIVVEAGLNVGGGGAEGRAVGFGEDSAAAFADALERLFKQVAPTMSLRAASGPRLRLSSPWPAARVRRVEKVIAESIIGVQAVRVAAIGGDGSVTLQIDGPLSAAELSERLAAVQVPGVTLVDVEVEAPDVVHARVQ